MVALAIREARSRLVGSTNPLRPATGREHPVRRRAGRDRRAARFTLGARARSRHRVPVIERGANAPDASGIAAYGPGYDPLNRLASLGRSNGHQTTLGFDAADRPNSLSQAFVGNAGNVAWTLGYTPVGQLASSVASTTQFEWNGAGAATPSNAAADGLNRDAAIAAVSGGGYDLNGNLINDGTRQFVYDGDNRLVTETAPSLAMSLYYEPDGRLVKSVINTVETTFLGDSGT